MSVDFSGRELDASAGAASTRVPEDLASFWAGLDSSCADVTATVGDAGISSPVATYEELAVTGPEGTIPVVARLVRPRTEHDVPLVVAFADYHQGVRGWHHLTRFVACGRAVVELDARALGFEALDLTAGWERGPEGTAFADACRMALRCAHAALALPGIDASRTMTWGEGLGGGLAIAVAAALADSACDCAVCNPLPAGLRDDACLRVSSGPVASLARHFRLSDPTHLCDEELLAALDYLDVANVATLLRGRLLVGCGLMDEVAPPAGTLAVYDSARASRSRRLVTYPRHAHERINEFENELLSFLGTSA